MVEGNGVWRAAAKLRLLLLRRRLRATSPNGSFAAATRVDGAVLAAVEAIGKSLFLHFESREGPLTVQLHFGMSGGFPLFRRSEDPGARKTSRLRLECKETEVVGYMSGIRCRLLTAKEFGQVQRSLGPDPLRLDSDPRRAWRAMQATGRGVGLALMDQAVLAGVGNIYRAEVLHRLKLHPLRPACSLSSQEVWRLWQECAMLLQLGARSGGLVTVLDAEWERLKGDGKSREARKRRWVYFRKSCLSCGGPVRCWTLGGRICFACEACQPPQEAEECQLVRSSGRTLSWPSAAFESDLAAGPPGLDASEAKETAPELRRRLAERLLATEGRKEELLGRWQRHRRFHGPGFQRAYYGQVSKEATSPWPEDVEEAKEFAALHCWRSPAALHAWANVDPKRFRYGRLSGRRRTKEGADLDVEALKELEVQGPPKALPEASATGAEPLTPPKTRARGGSPAPKRRKLRFPSLRGEGQVFDLRDQVRDDKGESWVAIPESTGKSPMAIKRGGFLLFAAAEASWMPGGCFIRRCSFTSPSPWIRRLAFKVAGFEG
ncbi:unnamed protein product [Effrenium voratum]|uniref:DNA-(apurinic or apyrimidinic site) lyase n=1 Tax=Effrenium voratum TaxID=2562239 RepID=A0AA36HM04_9DINO|nr:unnamed protein product [Effrenium voratum]